MYKLNTIILAALLLAGCSSEKPPHTISGQLKDAPGRMVYLELITDSGEVNLDSAKTDSEGNFSLANKANSIDYYMMRADATNAVFMILKGGEDVLIQGDAKDLENTYTISGSGESELIRQLKKFDKYLSDSLFYVFKQANATDPVKREKMMKESQAVYAKRMLDYSRRFIAEHPNSLVTLSVARFLDTHDPEDLKRMDDLTKRLLVAYPGNKYVQKYAQGMEELLALPAGTPAPEISIADTAGHVQKLSSFRGKVVLVDFWASWCAPCRKENPNVVAMYKKYKAKGFEVFSVSLDDDRGKWLTAIHSDGLQWTHVSELKGWDSEVVGKYRFNAIPFTVLVDRKGNIVDKGLRGEELESVLKEVL